MRRLLIFVAIVGVGAVMFAQYQANSESTQMSTCLEFVERFERAYVADRPQSESGPSDLRNAVPFAKRACNERRYAEAKKSINNAGMICRLNNGCEPKRAR
jgi:hypothetical protein